MDRAPALSDSDSDQLRGQEPEVELRVRLVTSGQNVRSTQSDWGNPGGRDHDPETRRAVRGTAGCVQAAKDWCDGKR